MTRFEAVFYMLGLSAFWPPAALAQDPGLFATTNQNPFVQIYSLPSPAEGPEPVDGRWAWHLSFDVTNNAIEDSIAGERIVLDGETYRTSVSLARTMSPRLGVRFTLPLVAHSPGMFDGLIHEWHSLFGLSNERRRAFERYSLEYSYVDDGTIHFAQRARTRGLGDVRLSADWRLRTDAPAGRSLSLRSGLKLPTGSSTRLHGSGSTDVSLQLLSTDRRMLANRDITLAWMVGGLWLGRGDVLQPLRRDVVAVASLGVSRPLWRNLTARVQLDGHTAFYDSSLRPLGTGAVQLTFGGSIPLRRGGRIDLAVVENLRTDPTPDVGLHLGWRRAY